ncbi:MAG: HIT family protein [Promethearchaeota archaeon]
MIREKDCIFCKIADAEIPSKIIFDNSLILAFLDIYPISQGHTIIIPKNHYSNLEDIPDYDLAEIYKVVKKVAGKIHNILKIDGYNILQNNFSAAGQVIKHFHVHVIPRKLDDDKFKLKIPRIQANESDLEKIYKNLKF